MRKNHSTIHFIQKVILIALLIIASQYSYGQEAVSSSIKKARYGFHFGLHQSSIYFANPKGIYVGNESALGFRLGINSDYKIGSRQVFFSPKAELTFYNNEIEFTEQIQLTDKLDYSFAAIEIKPLFTIELGETVNKPYLIFGGSYSMALAGEKESSHHAQSFFSIDFGVGFNKKLNDFIFAPELRYSHGLTDMNTSPSVNRDVTLHSLSLIFNFKG